MKACSQDRLCAVSTNCVASGVSTGWTGVLSRHVNALWGERGRLTVNTNRRGHSNGDEGSGGCRADNMEWWVQTVLEETFREDSRWYLSWDRKGKKEVVETIGGNGHEVKMFWKLREVIVIGACESKPGLWHSRGCRAGYVGMCSPRSSLDSVMKVLVGHVGLFFFLLPQVTVTDRTVSRE